MYDVTFSDHQFSILIEHSVPVDLLDAIEARLWELEIETLGERETFSLLLENLTLFRESDLWGDSALRKSCVLLVVLPPFDLSRGVNGKKRDLTLERRFCLGSLSSSGLEAVF